MCIGAAKSGTTSLYDILKQHSDVFIPSFKEPHFFDIPSVYKNGISWYTKTYFSGVKNEKCIGDFTPTYLFEEDTPKRIFNDLGIAIKFIVILRNPVDRAYSHYLHSKRDLHEQLSFNDAINRKLKKDDYLSYLRGSYIEQGMYADMLNRYMEIFPKENFLILHFEEDFIGKREETISRIFQFLNLDKENLKLDIRSNKASKAKLIWLKKLMKKTGWWRKMIKNMIPSLKVRQIIKNRIQRANIIVAKPEPLVQDDRIKIYDFYFSEQVVALEMLLKRKMNWK